MKKFIIILLVLSSGFVFAQDDYSICCVKELIVPKSLKKSVIGNLNNEKLKIIDTLYNPDGFIVSEKESNTYYLAINKNKAYTLFEIINSEFTITSIDTTFRISFNNSKNDELVIQYCDFNKWSHGKLGYEGSSCYTSIYDLDKLELIFSEAFYHYETNWGPDPNDADNNYDTTIVIQYDFQINKNEIKFEFDPDSSSVNFIIEPIIIYKNTKQGLKKKATNSQ